MLPNWKKKSCLIWFIPFSQAGGFLLFWVQPRRKVVDSTKIEEVDVPCLLPHEIFYALENAGPTQAPLSR